MRDKVPWQLSSTWIRAFSLAAAAAMAMGTLLPLLPGVDRDGLVLATLRGLGWLMAMVVTLSGIGWRAVQPGELDERERAERSAALLLSHRVTGLLLITAVLYGWPAATFGWRIPAPEQLAWLLGSAVWQHLMLPAAIFAWRNADAGAD